MKKIQVKITIREGLRPVDSIHLEKTGTAADMILLASVISALFLQSAQALKKIKSKIIKKK